MPYPEHEGDVAILHFGESQHTAGSDPENRFHPEWIVEFHALLDDIEAQDGPRALVTTGAGKYYSTGADLRWVAEHPDEVDGYLSEIQLLFARLLIAPLPTVAALQGHTFGAGAFLALAHDLAVMRVDRGYFCLPGITMGASYAPGTVALGLGPAGAARGARGDGQRSAIRRCGRIDTGTGRRDRGGERSALRGSRIRQERGSYPRAGAA